MGEREQVLEALGKGRRTGGVAHHLGWNTPRARYYLLRLEQAGKVVRDTRFTYENDIYWRPVENAQVGTRPKGRDCLQATSKEN